MLLYELLAAVFIPTAIVAVPLLWWLRRPARSRPAHVLKFTVTYGLAALGAYLYAALTWQRLNEHGPASASVIIGFGAAVIVGIVRHLSRPH
jgi:hypothetical protein